MGIIIGHQSLLFAKSCLCCNLGDTVQFQATFSGVSLLRKAVIPVQVSVHLHQDSWSPLPLRQHAARLLHKSYIYAKIPCPPAT